MNNKKILKIIGIIIVLGILLFTLTSCGNKEENTQTPSKNSQNGDKGNNNNAQVKLTLDKSTYTVGEAITVKITGVTDKMVDDASFVAIYKANAEHNEYGDYHYPKSNTDTLEFFAPDSDGDYEMRFYKEDHNYTDETFVLAVPFKVEGEKDDNVQVKLTLNKSSYTSGEKITVKITGVTAKMIKDASFVAIYKANAEHNEYEDYRYPKSNTDTLEFLAPDSDGDYEMRFYKEDHNYTDETFVLAVPFKVVAQ